MSSWKRDLLGILEESTSITFQVVWNKLTVGGSKFVNAVKIANNEEAYNRINKRIDKN